MRTTFLVSILLLLSGLAHGADRIYRVEVVVFAQDEAEALTAFRLGERMFDPEVTALENLEAPVRPEDPAADEATVDIDDPNQVNETFLRALFDEDAAVAVEQAPPVALGVLLEPAANDFDAVVERLRRHPDLTVLTDQRWYQQPSAFESPAYLRLHNDRDLNPDTAPPTAVSEDAAFWGGFDQPVPAEQVDPMWELDGRIALTEGTYFHLWLEAYYRQSVPDALPFAQRTARGIEAVDELVHALQGRHRLRLGEWLYFDSPYLGAVARVTRYEEPTAEQ